VKKFTLLQKLRNKIRIGSGVDLSLSANAKIVNCDIRIKGKNIKLVIGDGTVLRYTKIEILGDNCSILIGKNCILGHDCYLSAKEGRQLIIKDECMLSRNATLLTSDGHPIYRGGKIINNASDITIEEHVWLADNVTILKGVRIGKNSVVGINSTVTKDVSCNSIIAGNPARIVKDKIVWQE